MKIYQHLSHLGLNFNQADLGYALFNLGILQEKSNDLEGARESLQKALLHFRELAKQNPDNYQGDVANILGFLGEVQDKLYEREAGKESFQEALDIHIKMFKKDPDSERSIPKCVLTRSSIGAFKFGWSTNRIK